MRKVFVERYGKLKTMNKRVNTLFFNFMLLILVFTGGTQMVNAQLLGGQQNFAFLEIPVSARLTALTENIGVIDRDNTLAYRNPALLSEASDGQIHVSTLFHFDDVQSAFANYSHTLKKNTSISWHAGVNYLGYGDFERTDIRGINQGSFDASDIAIHLGGGYRLYERMQVGLNAKYISSSYDTYQASAMAWDIGAIYFVEEKRMSLAFTVNNFGWMFKEFTEESRSVLPTNVQLSFTKRFEHLPFRYSIVYHHLNNWNLEYQEETEGINDGFFTDDSAKESNFGTQLLRHLIVNTELLIGAKESLVIRASYDFLRRDELKLSAIGGGMGISMGVGIRLGAFRLDYGRAIYHQAGSNHHLSFSTNINSFSSKSKFE